MDKDNNIVVDIEHEKDNLEKSFERKESSHSSHRGHHHSHSHHHHHSKRRHHNSKKEKAKRFFKRYKYRLSNVVIAVLFVAILIVLGVSLDKRNYSDDEGSSHVSGGITVTDSTLQIEVPFFDGDVVLANSAVEAYMSSDSSVSAVSVYKNYVALGNLDKGKPVKISYDVNGVPEGCSVKSAELYISEKSDFSNSSVYYLSADETSADVYNLKTATDYFYRISLSFSNGTSTSVNGSFRTADSPRMLNVDGACNMRDIGGWKTLDGKVIKQGMLYRSAEIDGAVEAKYKVSSEGINTLLTVFGIRTDMDLRHSSDNPNGTDALGTGVEHIYYSAPMYSEAFTASGKASIRRVFADLADKSNYPVLLHCTHGMDRTGIVCYLLEALLGVSEEDLMKEYQLSAFYHGSLWSLNEMNEFIGQLKSYEGSTIQKKAESYLLSAGVTPAEIASIREIFLEG